MINHDRQQNYGQPGCAPKIRRAIGTPEASVFLEPQKTAAMRSGGRNRRRALPTK